jgi:thiamine pyrophosphokinase
MQFHFLDNFFYTGSARASPFPFVQLNQSHTPYVLRSWRHSSPRICADGGANRIWDALADDERAKFPPHYICGDLDSVRPDVLQSYQSLGTQIINKSFDQDSTDLEKCLRLIRRLIPQKISDSVMHGGKEYIVVDSALGGRMDHTMCNINSLVVNNDMNIVFTSQSCACFLLAPGSHIIQRNPDYESRTCGIIPLGQSSANIRSKGLKWELNNTLLGFGNMISGSNEFSENSGDRIEIETDVPLLWSNMTKLEELGNPKLNENMR